MLTSFYLAEFLPRLFLNDESHKELVDLVVLTPQWLMEAMRVIMELNIKDDVTELSTSQLQNLEKSGVADYEVLYACWKKMLSASESPCITVRHLCLIFQAYCLIYPIKGTLCAAKSEVQKYIIPCKLPKNIDDDVFKKMKKYATFFFDFYKFLPEEIYHRLICLASTYSKVKIQEVYDCYSKEICFFSNLEGTRWIIQMELEKQRLKVIVM